jgi:hypothetical protein
MSKELEMKKLLILFLFFPLFPAPFNAQSGCLLSGFIIKAGINYSTLRNSDSDFKLGYTFGIGKEWNVIKKAAIGYEINYTTRGGILKDKPIIGNLDDYQDVYSHDIHVSVGYIDIPLLLKYSSQIKNDMYIQLYIGPSFSMPISDNSDTKERRFLFYYDPHDPDKYNKIKNIKYFWEQESEFSIFNFDYVYNVAVEFKWSRFSAELRYSYGNEELGFVDMITEVKKKSHAINLLFGVCIP